MSEWNFFGTEVRECKSSNAYCRMCYSYYDINMGGQAKPLKKGEKVIEIITRSAKGRQTCMLCEKHAREFLAQMTEEMKKFDGE